jgi:hypothetical protein
VRSTVRLAARPRELLRCGLCHDTQGDLAWRCDRCGTLLHADCRASLEACPTLACVARAPRAGSRVRWRRLGEIAVAALSLLTRIVAFVLIVAFAVWFVGVAFSVAFGDPRGGAGGFDPGRDVREKPGARGIP